MPGMPRRRGTERRKQVPAVPRHRADRGSGRGRSTTEPVDFSRISGQAGGSADVPDECKPKDETGSSDDMWCRTKMTERALPEENSGFADHRPIAEPSGYDMYGLRRLAHAEADD